MGDELSTADLAEKITRLVEERGWNVEDFSRIAGLNRHTVRTILRGGERKLRNATIRSCAKALGLTVSELRSLPLDRLLPRMHGQDKVPGEDPLAAIYERSQSPDLVAWLDRNPDRGRALTADEVELILGDQGPDGALQRFGVERYIELLERRRRLLYRVRSIAGSEFLPLLEQIVELMFEKVQASGG